MSYPTAGVGGYVKNNTNTILNIQKWEYTPAVKIVNTTALGASGAWEANTPTTKGWKVKLTGFTDPSDTTGQLALLNGPGSTFTLVLGIDGTHSGTGSGILDGPAVTGDVGGIVGSVYSFTGTGAWTWS